MLALRGLRADGDADDEPVLEQRRAEVVLAAGGDAPDDGGVVRRERLLVAGQRLRLVPEADGLEGAGAMSPQSGAVIT